MTSGTGGPRVPTTPVAPGTGRRRWVAVALVPLVLLGVLAIASVGPDSERRSAIDLSQVVPRPTPRHTPTVSLAPPVATPLPPHEWFTAPAAPLGTTLITVGDSVRLFHFATGRLGDEALAKPGRDLLLRSTLGGTVCLCWASGSDGRVHTLDLVDVGVDGTERRRVTVTSLDPEDTQEASVTAARAALMAAPDGRLGYLVRVAGSRTDPQIGLDAIDLVSGSLTDTLELPVGPEGSDGTWTAVAWPAMSVADDGRHALVTGIASRRDPAGRTISRRIAWIVRLDGPSLGPAERAPAIADLPLDACGFVGFVASDRVAAACVDPQSDLATGLVFSRFDAAGRQMTAGPRSSVGDLWPPLINVTEGIAYLWHPRQHVLVAADIVGGDSRRAVIIDELANPRDIARREERPGPGPSVRWSTGLPPGHMGTSRIAGSPDGRLLYATGVGQHGGSSGIWVFDAHTLRLLERWPASAAYESLAILDDGRWLLAIGRPGVADDGRPADWKTSITIHDTRTGRPVVRFGDFGSDTTLTFPAPRPLAAGPPPG